MLRLLISDLEMSFGKVEVIHETQFRNSAQVAGMTEIEADELSYELGLSSAANHELPAVVVIEKLKDRMADTATTKPPQFTSTEPLKPEESPEPQVDATPVTESSTPTFVTVDDEVNNSNLSFKSVESRTSLIDMSMLKVVPNGYAGGFLDRHLVYLIEDQNRVINSENGIATCQVTRRFSDFVALRNYLLTKFAFRCVPKLPAKRVQMFSDEAFLLDRQKGLRRFLGIITRHHLYKSDPVLQSFLYNQKVNFIFKGSTMIYAIDRSIIS